MVSLDRLLLGCSNAASGRLVLRDGTIGFGGSLSMVGFEIFFERAVFARLKDRLGLDGLELGLESSGTPGMGRRVGATARIGWVVGGVILDFVAFAAPVALATTILLGLLGIGVGKAMLGEELGDMFLNVTLAGVVAIVELVRPSHDG
jgi:hypothetical protein